VISQIGTLRDLKIGNNNLSGELGATIAKLQNLEVLDLQRNALTSLPAALVELVRLRVFNLTENCFTSLPFEIIQRLPIIELSAAKNKLKGVLVAIQEVELRHLQVLDIVGNSLTSLTLGCFSLPSLHQLNCSANRLTSLPDMTTWKSLITLAAEDNSISFIPEGLVSLEKLKTVDFSGNNLITLDDRIGCMENLDILRISGNPLREKKFSSMSTEDLKRALRARLTPVETNTRTDLLEASDPEAAMTNSPARPTSSDWPVKAGGVLDRSNTQSYSLNPVVVAQISASNTIRALELHHNMFKEIPSSIGFFAGTLTTLSMAHNELTSDTFLKDDLDLPALKELNISSNTFNSLLPLIQRLQAPLLEKLDISFNRLTSLPVLRPHFPQLTILLASHNTIRELSPEAAKGLKVLDCSSNDISSLNPRIGLLGGPGGLERLDVSGNRFRVPKYTILEKGTEATLAWLRDRIPASETNPTEAA
jgi:Leucine-rich repeat (LRR) protein